MGSKRPLPAAEDTGGSRALKRWRPLVLEVLGEQNMQRFLVELEQVLHRVVREELMTLCANHVFQPSNQDKKIRYCLHFQNKLPKEFFTFNSILAEDGIKNLQIALMDSNLREVITSDPLSSVKVEIVVIYGDFIGDGHEYWTEKQFKDHIVPQRDGKGPLLTGELVIKLNKGVGDLAHATFTDNSSWTRNQKFRLGAILSQSECIEDRVQEGISEPFRVKDRRVESNQKHHSPSLTDEVWRLKNIMKDGKFHKRLVDGGIHTVQQFLQAFAMNHERLRSLLGDKAKRKEIPNKKWQGILEHAQKCPVGDELYSYSVSGKNVVLIFNSIYQLLGAKFDGHYHPMSDLTASQQKLVDNWKKLAFENPNDIDIVVDNLSWPITSINVSSAPGSSSLDPQIPCSNDEATTEVGFQHQPNAPHNEHSNVLFQENISLENKVHSIQESSSFQEPKVSNGLPVGSIPVHQSTAIASASPGLILPEPQNSDHPAAYTDEPAADMGFLQPLLGIFHEQDFSPFPQSAFFQGGSHMNNISDERSFRIESFTGRVGGYMPDHECEDMVVEYLKANLQGLPVSSIPVHQSAAIAAASPGLVLPEPQNSDHPATYTDEPAADMGFLQPLPGIFHEQDFSEFPESAFFQGESHMNNISDEHLFRIESFTGRVGGYMPDHECEEKVLEYQKASSPTEAVATSPRKWVKLIAGLKCGLSISKYLAARRTGIVHLSVQTVVPSGCLGTLGAGC